MGMTTIVRLECDRCLSHRDLTIGDTEELGVQSGLPMLVRWRAHEIGWRIHVSNAQKLTECDRCSTKVFAVPSVSMRDTSMPNGRF